MKKITWVNPDRMLMETGHKTFDRQTNIVSTGNIYANTQHARYVRGELCVRCRDSMELEKGHLRTFDLKSWRNMPAHVVRAVRQYTDGTHMSVWVSEFFHYTHGSYYRPSRRIVDGYIITRRDHTLLEKFVTGPTHKSYLVIEGVLPYVTNTPEA